jgi:GT2 family glycosyltransferase
MKKDVCAIVVTYNRKDLLAECLDALLKQTEPIQGIYLIDNASVDRTPEFLLQKGYISELPPMILEEPWEKQFIIKNYTNSNYVNLYYVRMNRNMGGAGGFYEGIKRAYKKGYSWFWLMDDDTIPKYNALEVLLEKIEQVEGCEIGFLSSKVLWTDGKPHLMNVQGLANLLSGDPKIINIQNENCTYHRAIPFNLFDDKGILLVNSASFVSLLINREVVKRVGLPIKEYFIWADDFEYTWRITEKGLLGLYVCESIVIHKTKTNYTANRIYDWRFYFNTRNFLWTYKLHDKIKYFYYIAKTFKDMFKSPLRVWPDTLRAIFVSLVTTPSIEYLENSLLENIKEDGNT